MSNYVTEALGRALLDLMREKSIEKITADELTTRAKLGRATYFRNFNAKEEIITQYIVILWRAYERTHHLKDYRIDDPYRVRRYFEFCLSMRADNDVIMTPEPILRHPVGLRNHILRLRRAHGQRHF